jgi:hypothetical protein
VSEKAAAPESEEKEDLDLVRLLVPFLGFFLLFLLGITWYLGRQRDALQLAVTEGQKKLPGLATAYQDIEQLVGTFRQGNAGLARSDTASWMKERYTAAGIQASQVTLDPWKAVPRKDYEEHYVRVVVRGIPREKALHFLWNVERATTKLRTVTMKLDRSGGRQAPEADIWDLTVTFGYRIPRGAKEGI